MEHTFSDNKKLISWFLKNRTKFSGNITQYKWTDCHCPGLFDFSVEIKVNGKKHYGHGTAWNKESALCKAIGEAFERYVLTTTSFSDSNGLAVHLDTASCLDSAKSEAIERDAFFCHYLTKTPFVKAPNHISTTMSEKFRIIFKYLQKLGIELRLAECRPADPNYNVFIAALFNSHQCAKSQFSGTKIGLGSAVDAMQAAEKAIFEAIRCIPSLESKSLGLKSINLDDYNGTEKPNEITHKRLGFDEKSSDVLRYYFDTTTARTGQRKNIEVPYDIEWVELPEILRDSPMVACRVSSPTLQNAYFGHLEGKHLNIQRLCQFSASSADDLNLQPYPHMLG